MGEGKLPNFKKLAGEGGFYRLGTSTSPESPTSWASFATGGNAGKHNIFDFLVRDVKTYVPDLGMVRREMPDFFLDYVPLGRTESDDAARRHVVLGDRGPGRRAVGDPDRAGDLPARGRPGGRTAVGPAAARHPGNRRHVLLLCDRPQPLRGRQHGDGRHPEAAHLRERHGPERAGGAAESDRPGADGRTPDEGRNADRGRPGADGGARGAGETSMSRSRSAGAGRPGARRSTSRGRPCGSTKAPGASGCRSSSA